jgi:hypothetical protein
MDVETFRSYIILFLILGKSFREIREKMIKYKEEKEKRKYILIIIII